MDYSIDEKKQKRREKIGLLVFCAALVAIFFAVFFYVYLGHSFDLAASEIDDNVGQLDGYLTIVVEGDNVALPKKPDITQRVLQKAGDLLRVQDSSSNDSQISQDTIPATVNNVSEIYKEKSSTLCKIKPSDYTAYSQGEIFERNNWKLGVISINQDVCNQIIVLDKTSDFVKSVQTTIEKLRTKDKADLILITCTDEKIAKKLEKVDCYLCKNVDMDTPETGKQVDSSFVMRVPETGTVGAITSSPAKMFRSRVYTSIAPN